MAMPELKIPAPGSGIHTGKHEEIKEVILSRMYKEEKLAYTINISNPKGVMPILPPVCDDRKSAKGNLKLPVIPILL